MFVKNNARFKALFAGLVLLVMAGSLFISCTDAGGNNDPVNAQQPSITVQPIGGNWNVTTDATFHLAVTASVTDGGTLSYQWYQNTTDTATGGTAIGTNSKDHHLNKADYTEGQDYYFYVVVTNTNNSVDGNKTAARTSDVVKVEVRTTGVTEGNPEEEEELNLPAGLNGYFQTPVSYSDWGASYGGWQWTDDGYAVNNSAKTLWYYNDSTMENGWGGTIEHHTPESTTTNAPAILIVKVSEIKGSAWGPSEEGIYYAVAYKNLTVSGNSVSVSACSPYSMEAGAKNDGVATLTEAISEYTPTSSYFGYFGNYVLHPITAADLSDLQGDWYYADTNETNDQYIYILGTTFFHFMDDVDDGDSEGYYDPDDEYDVLGLVGNIVDCTSTAQTSGALYIKVVKDAESVYKTGKFTAVGWKVENGDYQFALGTEVKETLAEIKTTYTSSTSFSGGWYAFEKE